MFFCIDLLHYITLSIKKLFIWSLIIRDHSEKVRYIQETNWVHIERIRIVLREIRVIWTEIRIVWNEIRIVWNEIRVVQNEIGLLLTFIVGFHQWAREMNSCLFWLSNLRLNWLVPVKPQRPKSWREWLPQISTTAKTEVVFKPGRPQE